MYVLFLWTICLISGVESSISDHDLSTSDIAPVSPCSDSSKGAIIQHIFLSHMPIFTAILLEQQIVWTQCSVAALVPTHLPLFFIFSCLSIHSSICLSSRICHRPFSHLLSVSISCPIFFLLHLYHNHCRCLLSLSSSLFPQVFRSALTLTEISLHASGGLSKCK